MVAAPVVTSTSSRGSWTWAFAGLALGLLAALVLFIPAGWLAARIEQESAGRVQLSDARGTLWSGSARLSLTGGAGSKDELALPSRVDWHVRPQWNGFRIELSTACCTAQPVVIRVKPGWSSATVTLTGTAPDALAQWIAQARLNARAIPAEAHLLRNSSGLWDGNLVLTLPARN